MWRAATRERARRTLQSWLRRRPALTVVLAVGAAASVVAGASGAASGPRLNGISARANARSTSVLIEASEPVAYSTSRPDPLTILVDLRNVTATGVVNHVEQGAQGIIAAVTVEETREPDGAAVARVRLRLAQPAQHTVRSARNVIEVEIDPQPPQTEVKTVAAAKLGPVPGKTPVSRPEPRAPAADARGASPATVLRKISAAMVAGTLSVTLAGDGLLVAAAVEQTLAPPYKLVLDFEGVKTEAPAMTRIDQEPVQRVRIGAYRANPPTTRVVFDLSRRARYRLEADGRDLRVVFDPPAAASSVEPPAAPPAAAPPAPAGVASADPMAALKQRLASQQAAAPAAAPAAPPAQEPSAAAPDKAAEPAAPPAPQGTPPVKTGMPQGKQYTGHPVSLDFAGLDLRAVLRVFTEFTGLNIVIDPTVTGSVDVVLKEVPWDQALDMILRSNKLGWTLDGTIVRIAPLTVLSEEEAQRRRLADEQALSGELKTLTKPLSYAKGDEIRPLLEKSELLSKRGTVQFDARTNTLIIRDLADRLGPVVELVATLDKPELQVEIEARIVRTTSDYARALGVDWSFTGRMAPDLANTTGLAFPNSVGGSGGVSLPAAATNDITSKVRLSLGSVNGSFNLDIALSALEKQGKARVLLQPRVLMQNNVEGYIMRGQQIPYTTAQAGAAIGGSSALLTPATVQFKDAALSLKVTPQVTAAGTVFMKIEVENSFPNYAVTRPEQPNPAIDTQKASTRVLVPDGATTVIGGIYETSEDSKTGRTPGMHRIPLLGWLFKNEDKKTENNELLIFITPRIIRVQ